MRYKSVRNCDIFYAFVFIIIFVLLHTVILEYYAIFKNGGNSFSSNNVEKNGFKEKVLARKSRKKLIKNAILKEPSPTSEEEAKLLELNTNFFQIRNKVLLKFVLTYFSLFFVKSTIFNRLWNLPRRLIQHWKISFMNVESMKFQTPKSLIVHLLISWIWEEIP